MLYVASSHLFQFAGFGEDVAMATKMFDLTGKVAVVTGGNGGIGLGMAHGLADAGASIVIAARNEAKSKAALDDLHGRGAKAVFIATDVTEKADVDKLFAAVQAQFGRLDILVNNAGINIRGTPQSLALADWSKVIDTNLTSAFLCSQAAHAPMKAAGGGKIINIGSMMSIFGSSYAAAYAASKGGIVQLTKSLAVAWAADNIQVNAVLPGWIDTDLTRGARQQVKELHDNVLRRTPAKRWGEMSDMSGVAVFLASQASDFVTGAEIAVDGGYSSLG
jgi:2-dehydro-3-deoxy-D-gluconate 5-dehydrogenase